MEGVEKIDAGDPRKVIVRFSFTQSSALYNYYMDSITVDGVTYQNSIEKHLIPYFGKHRLSEIHQIDIQN